MAGHGSDPPPDRGSDPSRVVTRESGLVEEYGEHKGVQTHIREFPLLDPRFPSRSIQTRKTRFTWEVGERAEQNKHSDIFAQGRGGGVKSLQRARIATRSAANRMVERRNLYSGQPEG